MIEIEKGGNQTNRPQTYMNENQSIKFVENLQQGSQEWHDFRRLKMTASRASAVVNKSPWQTPLQLFDDMLLGSEAEANDAMKRGTAMEPIARDWINARYCSDLQPQVVVCPDNDWHVSSLDGIWQRPDGSWFVCEIKCPGRIDHDTAMCGIIPEKYLPQLIHIVQDLPGVDRILYVSYRDESQAEIWFSPTKDQLKDQFKKEADFYSRLLTCIPPDPVDRDFVTIYDDSFLTSEANKYHCLKKDIDVLQAELDATKKNLMKRVVHPRVRIGDVKISRISVEGRIDYKKACESLAVEKEYCEKFRGEKTFQTRFTICEE